MNWSRNTFVWAFICLSMTASPAKAESFSTRSVKFMEGEWICKSVDNIAQEIWTSAQGDGMVGICRHIEGEKTTLLELMTLKEKNGGLYLQIKHFDGDMKPWPSSKESGECKLVSGDHFTKAVFENISKNKLLRLTYQLRGGKLNALVEVTKKTDHKKFEFEYQQEKYLLQTPKQFKLPIGDFDSHMP